LLDLQPKTVLEIGCSNGWRLHAINQDYRAKCFGIDPSLEAISAGRKQFPQLSLEQGTADELPYEDNTFDTVIFGFCLYLCDRKDLFKIAYEADRVLADLGNIIILDFHPTFPYRNDYSHYSELFSYKMKYSNLFSWNPIYSIMLEKVFTHSGAKQIDDPDDRLAVVILKKNLQHAYPDNPYSLARGCHWKRWLGLILSSLSRLNYLRSGSSFAGVSK
jgi:ubiquinone/menaquinone biosynthesis C-methylase UbiE